ncbi:hypothetical protein [Flammeovirga sp. EKP202]|uniref:hypothetical protein n=1 Tax=Flammeovirga sp. EKP202 TaxID=2770592 RepID=UPI00165EC507|nr:hypothetical protein [Flammeovirga sp. EKP202]MBD0401552.1 hypothetical protein [Flammeovirga sp. EKP202]
MMIRLFINLSILFIFFGCNKTETCPDEILKSQMKKMDFLSRKILNENPKLLAVVPNDSIKIDISISSQIDSLFKDLCFEINETKSFESFALVYWFNVKRQWIVNYPNIGTSIVPENFLDEDKSNSRRVEARTLYILMKKNNIDKKLLRNGFTMSEIKFPKSEINMLYDCPYIKSILNEIDLLEKEVYNPTLLNIKP